MPKAKESTPRSTTAKTSSSTKGMGTVGKVMHEYKLGTLKSGKGGTGGKVKSVSGGGRGGHFGGPSGTRPLIVSGGGVGPKLPSESRRKIFLESMPNFGNHESTSGGSHSAARL
jgi:hypothetical protein